MEPRRYVWPIFAVLMLSACISRTGYHAGIGSTGYAATPLGDGRYDLSYTATAITSSERLQQYLLYHAAELTLDRGYPYFEVLHDDPGRGPMAGFNVTGETARSAADFEHHHLWFQRGPLTEGMTTSTYEPNRLYTARLSIQMLPEKPHDELASVFDARDILVTLGPSVIRGP